MSWETRPGSASRYYCRSRKVEGRIIRQYFGKEGSPGAELAAATDALRHAEEKAERDARRACLANWRIGEEPLLDLTRLTDLLIAAALYGANYYRHGGEWRYSHGSTEQHHQGSPATAR
jgi:hypothetical protein